MSAPKHKRAATKKRSLPKNKPKGSVEGDELEACTQDTGRAAKRGGTARSDHLSWMQKLQTKSNKNQTRIQMRIKQLRNKIRAAGPEATGSEHSHLLCTLALIMRRQQNNKELGLWKKALAADPDNGVARRGLLSAFMDAAEAVEARAICDRFPDDNSTAFAWSRALLEYLSCHVLEEKDTSPAAVEAALRTAFDANPFVALFMAHCGDFTEIIGPERIEALLADRVKQRGRAKREGTEEEHEEEEAASPVEALAAAALEYCVVGVSCWMDAPEGLEFVCAAAEEQGAIQDGAKKLALSKTAVAGLPCTRLLRKACIELGLLRSVMPRISDADADAAAAKAQAEVAAAIAELNKDGLSNRARSKRRRRKNAMYTRAVNRKKGIYGGNSNDLCVYIE